VTWCVVRIEGALSTNMVEPELILRVGAGEGVNPKSFTTDGQAPVACWSHHRVFEYRLFDRFAIMSYPLVSHFYLPNPTDSFYRTE
jgi:hypothetical protein